MAAAKGIYDALYRVMGAGKATAANKRVSRSLKGLQTASRSARTGLLGMSSALTGQMVVIAAAGLAVRRVTTDYASYTRTIANMNTTLAAQTVNHRQNTRVMSTIAEGAGRRFGFSLNESNEAMTTMLQTGLGMHRSSRVFATALQLSRVAGMSSADAVQFLTDTMNMFRNEQAESGESTQNFARRMGTQLSVAANMASTNIDQLRQAFRYAGGEMSSLGYSSQDTMAALAALSSVGLRGTTAGTRLRGAIAALHTPSSTATRLLREMGGVTEDQLNNVLYDTAGRLRDLSGEHGAMSQLNTLMQQMPTEWAQNTAVIRIFGRRSQAAGNALSGLSEAGERTERIISRLRETDVRDGSILDEQSEAQMRSFGMQMQQLSNGVNELAVGFGEVLFAGLGNSRRGFGTVFREMAVGIRLAGSLGNMTADQRREWDAMSETTQQQAISYRQLFVDVSNILRLLGRLSLWALGFIRDHPYVVLGLLAIRLAFGGVGTAAMSMGRGLVTTSAYLQRVGVMANGASIQMGLMRLAVMGLAVHVAGQLTDGFQSAMLAGQGMNSEFSQLTQGAIATRAGIARTIPVFGTLIAQWIELFGIMRAAWDINNENDRRQQSAADVLHSANVTGVNSQIAARMSQRRAAPGGLRGTEDEVRGREVSQMASASRMDTAALLHSSGFRTEGAVRGRLSRAGVSGDDLSNQVTRIMQAQRHQTEEGMRLRSLEIAQGSNMQTTTNNSITRLQEFIVAVNNARIALDSASLTEMGVDPAPGASASIPAVNDGYVSRTGLLRATAGDIVVNRDSLASAVSMPTGGMVGPLLGQQQTVAGVPGTGGGEPSGGIPTVVVQIDGREIARAVGREHSTHLERSGAGFAPGQRRTMRETGFVERSG